MKLVAESLKQFISGGKGDDTKPKDVCPDQLKVGIAVEMEHTSDPKIAEEIAIDHLTENPKYYTDLCNSGIVDEPEAIKLYNELLK